MRNVEPGSLLHRFHRELIDISDAVGRIISLAGISFYVSHKLGNISDRHILVRDQCERPACDADNR